MLDSRLFQLIWSFLYLVQQLYRRSKRSNENFPFSWLSFHFCFYRYSHRDSFILGWYVWFGLVSFWSVLHRNFIQWNKNRKFLMTLIPVDITPHRQHSFVFNFIHIHTSPIVKNQSCRLFLALFPLSIEFHAACLMVLRPSIYIQSNERMNVERTNFKRLFSRSLPCSVSFDAKNISTSIWFIHFIHWISIGAK